MALAQVRDRFAQNREWTVPRFAKVFCWLSLYTIALAFVAKYAIRYYVHFNEPFFRSVGAPNYWPNRGWLMLHISGGVCAILTGAWQFWTGFRRRYVSVHRWMGRIFLLGVLVGSIGAFHMVYTTSFGWAWGFALASMGFAWLTTSTMAYYSILRRQVQVHKEWMIRAYVVTFAFVTFRLLFDYGPTSRLQPEQDRGLTFLWLSWAIPLLITEVLLQFRRIPRPPTTRST